MKIPKLPLIFFLSPPFSPLLFLPDPSHSLPEGQNHRRSRRCSVSVPVVAPSSFPSPFVVVTVARRELRVAHLTITKTNQQRYTPVRCSSRQQQQASSHSLVANGGMGQRKI
ncbi:hypothetical protein TIFTF001_002326 [Ficus carica]|uniref:Uncharacterized protein n=1 Tax=Ficus carica TaxID=3494 RepID=A0AA87Z3D1_FICCA|nr:hypothetical protein TIFTF001_002326 [Ficus carica]